MQPVHGQGQAGPATEVEGVLRAESADPLRVLLVEDDPDEAALVRRLLGRIPGRHHLVTHATRLSEVPSLGADFDVVLLDLSLPDGHGLDSVISLTEALPGVPLVVLSGAAETTIARAAVRLGAQDYLLKHGQDARSLARGIALACERQRAARELERSRDELEARVRERTRELEALVRLLEAEVAAHARAQAALAQSLAEKDALLAEIHHRVKNNMQVVSSILSLEAARIEDPTALRVFDECMARVRAMSLVHEQLYESSCLDAVPARAFLDGLVRNIGESRPRKERPVRIELDVDDGLRLGSDAALNLGLILHELLANALEHAFPDDREGTVSVRLQALPEGGVRLEVMDDGVGLPADWETRRRGSLGLNLVASFAARLGARLDWTTMPGTCFRVCVAPRASDGVPDVQAASASGRIGR